MYILYFLIRAGVSPPLIRAMAERKHFFLHEVFPKVLAALEPLDPSTRLAQIYVGFNAILGCCSRRAEQIKEAAQKSD